MTNPLAFDRSVRSFDKDGRLHVDLTNISKAMVCPYMGSEIPGAEELGLDSGKIYQLLRDPEELAKAAPTFNNLPLLIKHVPVSAEAPRRDLIVGTTGSDVAFNEPYLQCSLSIWDADAIAGVESRDQAELSSAYHYRADMTPGEYDGTAYDGIMRDIIGNHVALVDVGRAGHDVVVADKDPFITGQSKMKKKLLLAALEGFLAQDADMVKLDGTLDKFIAQDEKESKEEAEREKCEGEVVEDEDDDELYEDDPDNPGKRRKKQTAQDEGEDEPEKAEKKKEDKAAMDAAIKKACAETEKRTVARVNALHEAREKVAPMVGRVALDSAEAVYRFALEKSGIKVEGVHPSAFSAMVDMHLAQKDAASARPAPIAQDAEAVKAATDKFPNLNRFKRA